MYMYYLYIILTDIALDIVKYLAMNYVRKPKERNICYYIECKGHFYSSNRLNCLTARGFQVCTCRVHAHFPKTSRCGQLDTFKLPTSL